MNYVVQNASPALPPASHFRVTSPHKLVASAAYGMERQASRLANFRIRRSVRSAPKIVQHHEALGSYGGLSGLGSEAGGLGGVVASYEGRRLV